jgi:hypothetical protein
LYYRLSARLGVSDSVAYSHAGVDLIGAEKNSRRAVGAAGKTSVKRPAVAEGSAGLALTMRPESDNWSRLNAGTSTGA